MKKIFLALIPLAITILSLVILWKTFDIPFQEYHLEQEEYLYSSFQNFWSTKMEAWANGMMCSPPQLSTNLAFMPARHVL